MKKDTTNDMTVGSPVSLIIKFMIPMCLGNLFQQFYNIADSIVAGKFIGVNALAAIGSTGSLMFFVTGWLNGLSSGFAIIVAQMFGAKKFDRMRHYVAMSIYLMAAFSIVMTIGFSLANKPILHLMNSPEEVFGDVTAYMGIIYAGLIITGAYNALAAFLRALGDSKSPLYFLIISAVINVILDVVFIVVFGMGVEGCGYATVIAQGISGILCLLYIAKKVPALYLHREDWEIDKNLAGWQLKIGLPMAFQYSITAIGTIVVQSCLNILGSTAAAGFAAASKIEQVFTQAYVALGTTMATYCAQNMGAGKYTRIRKGFKSATLIGFIYAVVTGVIIFFVGKYMTIFFVSENVNQIMEYVDIYLRCVSVSFLPLVIVNLYRNGIQGMGYGLLPMTAGIAELVGRSGASLIASHFGSYMGICLASPAAWVLAGTLLLIMYFEIMKGKKDRNLKNR